MFHSSSGGVCWKPTVHLMRKAGQFLKIASEDKMALPWQPGLEGLGCQRKYY